MLRIAADKGNVFSKRRDIDIEKKPYVVLGHGASSGLDSARGVWGTIACTSSAMLVLGMMRHREAYQHKTTTKLECHMVDILEPV